MSSVLIERRPDLEPGKIGKIGEIGEEQVRNREAKYLVGLTPGRKSDNLGPVKGGVRNGYCGHALQINAADLL